MSENYDECTTVFVGGVKTVLFKGQKYNENEWQNLRRNNSKLTLQSFKLESTIQFYTNSPHMDKSYNFVVKGLNIDKDFDNYIKGKIEDAVLNYG